MPPAATLEQWRDGLLELGRTLEQPAVLIPSSDRQVHCMALYKESLLQYYRFSLPSASLLELLGDKLKFCAFAKEAGYDIPRTFVRPAPEEVADIAAQLHYPCLIKPHERDAEWDRLFANRKVVLAETPQELISAYRVAAAARDDLLIQEMVPGPDTELIFSNAYLDSRSRVVALWTGRKLRQLPIHFGTSTLAESIWDPTAAAITQSLLTKLRFTGYANIEFKRDARDGKYKIMEITPARTWYPHLLGTAAGVNIPYIWYCDLLGLPKPRKSRFRQGVVWVDEYRDLFAVLDYRKEGTLSLRRWIGSYRGTRAFALASWRDPLPILFVALRLAIGVYHEAKKLVLSLARSHGRPRLAPSAET